MTRLNVAYEALRTHERRVAHNRAEASRDAPDRSYRIPTNPKRHVRHSGLWLVVLWLAAFSIALVMLGSLTAGTAASDRWHVGSVHRRTGGKALHLFRAAFLTTEGSPGGRSTSSIVYLAAPMTGWSEALSPTASTQTSSRPRESAPVERKVTD